MDNARLYKSANALQRNDAARVLEEIVPQLNISRSSRVLDVGCGSGDVTADILLPLLPKGIKNLVGVDKSEKMIHFATEFYGNNQLSFYNMDIEDVTEDLLNKLDQKVTSQQCRPLKEKPSRSIDILLNGIRIGEDDYTKDDEKEEQGCRFDFLFSIYCLHWVRNQRQAFQNLYSLLKHGGEAVMIILAESAIFTMYQKLANKIQWASYMQDVDRFISPYHETDDPAGMLCDLAASSGFQVVSAECQPRTFAYNSYHALKEAIKAVSPFCNRMTAHESEDFLTDCINVVKLGNLAEEMEGHVAVSYSIVVARLRK